jgi:hypothetical protein
MLKDGQDGNREYMRFSKLVPVIMGIARADTKSDYACEEAYEKLTALRALIETIPANVTRSVPTGNEGTDVNVEGHYTVAIAALPVSQTKERGPGRSNLQSEIIGSAKHTSTYKHKQTVDGKEVIGSRSCGVCGLKGQYLTTCPMNPNISHAMEKKGISRGGVRKIGRPRTRRGSPEMWRDSMDEHDLDDVDEEYDESD